MAKNMDGSVIRYRIMYEHDGHRQQWGNSITDAQDAIDWLGSIQAEAKHPERFFVERVTTITTTQRLNW